MFLIPTPADNAAKARTALTALPDTASRDDLKDEISDLIGNLLHLAEAEGINPLAAVERGATHFMSERELTLEQCEVGDIGRDWQTSLQIFHPDGYEIGPDALPFEDMA